MDEILVANYMVFDDLLSEEPYDLVVGDEAWELDYFLHENPERKRTAFAWMTDFVGWLPMSDGGQRETALTADYNSGVQQRGRGDDQNGAGLGLAGRSWRQQQAEVAVADPARLQNLAERIRAKLVHCPTLAVLTWTLAGSGYPAHPMTLTLPVNARGPAVR